MRKLLTVLFLATGLVVASFLGLSPGTPGPVTSEARDTIVTNC